MTSVYSVLWNHSITMEKGCLTLSSSSANQGSTDNNIHPIILSIRIQWLCSKGNLNKLLRSSTTLDLIQYLLCCYFFRRILAGSSRYMVSRIHDDTTIPLPRGITLSIPGLPAWGCIIVSYYGMRVPRLSFLYYH